MKKGIELPKETIDALISGANMFIMPIDQPSQLVISNSGYMSGVYIDEILPLQTSDKFYIQEAYTQNEESLIIYYENDFKNPNVFSDWCDYCDTVNFPKEYMHESQSRVKGKIVNVEVKKVQDITRGEADKILPLNHVVIVDFCHNNWFNNQFNIKYEDNPYVFLYTIEKEG